MNANIIIYKQTTCLGLFFKYISTEFIFLNFTTMNNKKNKRTKSSSTKNLNALKRGIIALFKGSDRPLTHKDICRLLQVKDKITKHQILFVIKNLLADQNH